MSPRYIVFLNGTTLINESNIAKLKAELDKLVEQAEVLYIAMAIELKKVDAATKKRLMEKFKTLPNVRTEYEE